MLERKPFLLRLPPDVWEELQRLAAEDLPSANAEIEFHLRQAVRKRNGQRRLKS